LTIGIGRDGHNHENKSYLDEAIDSFRKHVLCMVALIHTSRGEKDEAFEWLDNVLNECKLRVGMIKL